MPELSVAALAGIALAVAAGYTVFGLTGFGSAVVAVPILAHVLPLQVAVPLMLLLDMGASLVIGWRNRQHVERQELMRLFPAMLVGIALGVTVLVGLSAHAAMLALGVFVVANALWSLLAPAARSSVSPAWSLPAGVAGGTFGALFGTGGPIYTIYLARRIGDARRLRSTIAVMILLSALTRLVAFALAGLLLQPAIAQLLPWLLPVMLLAVYAGSRLHARLAPAQVRVALAGVLLAAGLSLLWRALSSA